MICFREVGFCVALFKASLKPGKQVTVVVNMSLFENVCYECSFYNVTIVTRKYEICHSHLI